MNGPFNYLFIPVIGPSMPSTISGAWDEIRTMLKVRLEDDPEHVTVLYEGNRRDMFVGAESAINGKHIRNVRATEIYRNNWLTHHPGTDPESMPAVSGPAILFPNDIVWK